MTTLTGWLTIANLIILVIGGIAGTLVFRSQLAKTESDVQQRVRDALSAENELLQSRVNRLEKDNRQLHKTLQLIARLLKKIYSVELEVDGDLVVLHTPTGTHTARLDTDPAA